jgi:hypothetical protein
LNIADLKQSKFLKQSDVGAGVLVTMSSITEENVAIAGAEPDMKACLHFNELDKPLVLNSTNGQLIAKITGFEDNIESNWIGHKVVLYTEPNISFNGRLVGGIRARAPKPQAGQAPEAKVLPMKPAPVQTQAPQGDMGDNSDLPF